MEVFKVSKKSICHNCFNVKEKCENKVSMMCGTDRKIGGSFVQTCGSYNRKIKKYNSSCASTTSISVGHSADTRKEMMGGGH
jgi:hypothetical protein